MAELMLSCCVPPAASRDPPACLASSSGRAPRSCRAKREAVGCGVARKEDLERIRLRLGRAADEKTAERNRRVERLGGDQTSPIRPRRAGRMHEGHAGAWPRHGGERGERGSTQ